MSYCWVKAVEAFAQQWTSNSLYSRNSLTNHSRTCLGHPRPVAPPSAILRLTSTKKEYVSLHFRKEIALIAENKLSDGRTKQLGTARNIYPRRETYRFFSLTLLHSFHNGEISSRYVLEFLNYISNI